MRPRHPNTKVRRHGVRQGFSLTEVMLAIFILGIGVIAVAALFPAGIAQQQQSVDDVIGPIVANNALSVIRSKLRAEDFGTFEEYGATPPLVTVPGDWPWLRPGFIFPGASSNYPDGAIDIFNGTGLATAAEPSGIPFSAVRHGSFTPHIVFTQGERYYPMFNRPTTFGQPPRKTPQYVWDCMFRKFQGKVLVAIFVYRAVVPGGGAVPYTVPADPSNSFIPPLPIHLPLDPADPNVNPAFAFEGPWDAGDPVIDGTSSGPTYNASDQRQSWQEPRQWILDQNNNLYRTLSRRLNRDTNRSEVELVRPASEMPPLAVYAYPSTVADTNGNGQADQNVVGHIWYIPAEVTLTAGGTTLPVTLTPVYVTVREL